MSKSLCASITTETSASTVDDSFFRADIDACTAFDAIVNIDCDSLACLHFIDG